MTNTIVRAPRRHRFVIIDQRAIEDSRLSWAARGLLGYLLSRPDDWKVLVNDLRKRGDLGRDGIYRLLRELKTAGYVRFVQSRDSHGRMRCGSYLVQEIAHSPHPDLPDTVEPDTAAPDPVNPDALPSTEKDLKRTTTTTPTFTQGPATRTKNRRQRLEVAAWVPEALHSEALAKVSRLRPVEAQIVLDEWAGIMAHGHIKDSPLGYLHVLVCRFESGEFRLQYADEVAERRSGARSEPQCPTVRTKVLTV